MPTQAYWVPDHLSVSGSVEMGRASWLLFVAMVTAVMLAQPVSAGLLTSAITDPAGDAFLWIPAGPAPGYLDVVGATIALKDGRFVLVMEMAESIPANPTLPPGTKLLEWAWEFETNPATFPTGFPWGEATTSPVEYVVQILWDGTSFRAQLIDRTPLLTGGEAVVSPLSFKIKGAELMSSVDAAVVGNPSSFHWISITRQWQTDLGTYAWFPVDGSPLGTWPS